MLLAAMIVGAAPAHGQIYRWLDANGALMYSTDRPADPGALKDFAVIDPVTPPPTSTMQADPIARQPRLPAERDVGARGVASSEMERGPIVIRDAPQILPPEPAASPAPLPMAREPAVPTPSIAREPVIAAPTPSTSRTEGSRQAKPEPITPSALAREVEAARGAPASESQPSRTITIVREPEPPARPAVAADKPTTPKAASQETEASERPKAASETPPRRRARVNPNLPEAVQDPCLRSSDPKCYDKNKNAYVPFRGYSPTAAEARESGVTAPVGATPAAAAGGSVSGGTTGQIKAPKASDYALPPGSEQPKKLSK